MGDQGGSMKQKSAKSIVFYRVRGRGRPFRRRVAKATWLGPRFLSATLGVRMRGRGRELPPGTSHRHVKPTARNPTVQGTVWVKIIKFLTYVSNVGPGAVAAQAAQR